MIKDLQDFPPIMKNQYIIIFSDDVPVQWPMPSIPHKGCYFPRFRFLKQHGARGNPETSNMPLQLPRQLRRRVRFILAGFMI
jgi:hypothetical protein